MLDWLQWLDSFLRGMTAAAGMGLIGLMLVRTDARGRIKIIGLEWGPLFQPSMRETGRLLAIAFVVCVALEMMRWAAVAVAA